MATTRETAERAQKWVNAMFALADAEEAKDDEAIESATKDLLFETLKL